MTLTPYYDFMGTKAEEEKGEMTGKFPLSPIRCEYVDFRDDNPQLLNLFDQWEIRKVLTPIDVGSLGGLVLNQEQVMNSVFKYWNHHWIWKVMERGEQVPVVMRDLDTNHEFNLYMKKFMVEQSCFVISTFWMRDFVHRRELKEGDTIGLYWDCKSNVLCFSLLKRA